MKKTAIVGSAAALLTASTQPVTAQTTLVCPIGPLTQEEIRATQLQVDKMRGLGGSVVYVGPLVMLVSTEDAAPPLTVPPPFSKTR